ncbi:MAG: Gfo/Idh/MocA family oxidoreductase [Terrimicrobiaceae bacterium]
MKPLNFAVIGCGMLARLMHLPNLVSLAEANLHTCCDINEDNLSACEPFHPQKLTRQYEEAVNDPEVDALVVATTEVFRIPIIEAAARAGKPVYCEKPLADTLENALAIQRLVEESGIPFCVGHNRRSSPAMMEARNIFTSHMRDPQRCDWRFERPGWDTMDIGTNPGAPVVAIRINDDWKSWKCVHMQNDLNRKVGLLLSEGTHFADLATWFLESDPASVVCVGQGVLNHAIVISYANGGLATITMASAGSFGYPKELLEAMGDGAVVACDHMLEVRTAGIAGSPAIKTFPMLNDRHPAIGNGGGVHGWLEKKRAACEEAEQDPMQQFTAEPDKGHRRMLQEFCREIRGERGPVCPVSDAITATRVCLAAAKSYIEKRSVMMTEIAST